METGGIGAHARVTMQSVWQLEPQLEQGRAFLEIQEIHLKIINTVWGFPFKMTGAKCLVMVRWLKRFFHKDVYLADACLESCGISVMVALIFCEISCGISVMIFSFGNSLVTN